jgi:hypothetical protein
MEITIIWNSVNIDSDQRVEVEENLRNEIESAYSDFDKEATTVKVSLHYDQISNAIFGCALSKNNIDIILSYSLQDKHTAVYSNASTT